MDYFQNNEGLINRSAKHADTAFFLRVTGGVQRLKCLDVASCGCHTVHPVVWPHDVLRALGVHETEHVGDLMDCYWKQTKFLWLRYIHSRLRVWCSSTNVAT